MGFSPFSMFAASNATDCLTCSTIVLGRNQSHNIPHPALGKFAANTLLSRSRFTMLSVRQVQATLPHTTVYITSPWGGFRRSIARKPRGSQHRTIRLPKALAEMVPTPTFWHRHYSNGRDIQHGKSAQGGVIYTVVYGTRCIPH